MGWKSNVSGNIKITELPNLNTSALIQSGKAQAVRPLSKASELIKGGNVRATQSALSGTAELGLTFADMIAVVQSLKMGDFHKSMEANIVAVSHRLHIPTRTPCHFLIVVGRVNRQT